MGLLEGLTQSLPYRAIVQTSVQAAKWNHRQVCKGRRLFKSINWVTCTIKRGANVSTNQGPLISNNTDQTTKFPFSQWIIYGTGSPGVHVLEIETARHSRRGQTFQVRLHFSRVEGRIGRGQLSVRGRRADRKFRLLAYKNGKTTNCLQAWSTSYRHRKIITQLSTPPKTKV